MKEESWIDHSFYKGESPRPAFVIGMGGLEGHPLNLQQGMKYPFKTLHTSRIRSARNAIPLDGKTLK